jgi:DNA polymerase-1
MQPKAEHAICDKCPLKNKSFAASTGPTDAKIAVVSRSPGHYEAIRGKSFSGPSGRILDHLLKIHGVDRKDVFATNAVLCQADGTEQGFGLAVACCEPRLKAEIANADTIIAAGREAAYSVLGVSNVGQNRGYPHFVQTNGKAQRVIVTNNPAVVLRDDATYPELVRDFRLAIAPLPTPKLPKVRFTENVVEAREWVEQILPTLVPGTLLASDLETRSEGDGAYNRIVCAGFSTRSERAIVFGESVCYNNDFLGNYLRRLYEIPGISYLWHNGKYDVKVLRRAGINARVDHDSMLVSWCLDERPGDPDSGAGGHSLEWLLKDELGWPKYEPPSVRQFKKDGILADAKAHEELYKYNGHDTAGTISLFEVLKERAINDNVWEKPYLSLLIRLSEALARTEMQGTIYDAEESCNILERVVWPKLRAQRAYMRELCGVKLLNPNSPKQLEKLMYDDWGLHHNLIRSNIERVGKRSTDKFVRDEILQVGFNCNDSVHRETFKLFVETLDQFKELDKQRGTYLEGLVLKRSKDGRIYTDFKIHGTESGRVSGNKPNLQNITRPKDGLPNIRSAFVPDPGCIFVSADLSQAELRAIAALSGDEQLQSVYTDTSRSLHKEVATQFYGSDYTYEQYVVAKNINFGVAYWQSAYSFAQMYHISQEEAQNFIDYWWNRFPAVWDWTKHMEALVLKKGEIQSPFGHKRRFYVIPQDESARIHVVKEGINFLPQNIAANITNWALCEFTEWLTATNKWDVISTRITVHDSILVNCKQAYVPEAVSKLKECLETAPQKALGWEFPFVAEFSVGSNWGQMEDYHENAYSNSR